MTAVVADTHTIIWYLQASKQLSAKATTALDQATQSGNFIYLSAITSDRIIAATALALKLPLITRDAQIQNLNNLDTIW